MKTGLGLKIKYRVLIAYLNLIRFTLRKVLIGFDYANMFLQRVDKLSLSVILINNGAKIGKNCDIETGQVFHNCISYSNLSIGNNCHIGKNCFFDLREKIIIEDNVVISMQCAFITHIDMIKSNLSKYYPSKAIEIKIYENSYLGARTTILFGVTIERNCVIASNSMINKNTNPYTIVAGIPGKLIDSIVSEKKTDI